MSACDLLSRFDFHNSNIIDVLHHDDDLIIKLNCCLWKQKDCNNNEELKEIFLKFYNISEFLWESDKKEEDIECDAIVEFLCKGNNVSIVSENNGISVMTFNCTYADIYLSNTEKVSSSIDCFFEKMLEYFPSVIDEYENHIIGHNERLDTVIIEDLFMPKVMELLKENKNTELLQKLFNYFEEVCNSDDEYLINIFFITALEILGNDKATLETAKKYMGSTTKQLQIDATEVWEE